MPETEAEYYQWGYKKYDPFKDRMFLDIPMKFATDKNLVNMANKGYTQARRDFLFPYVANAMNAFRSVAEEYNVSVPPSCRDCYEGWSIKIEGVTYKFNPGDFE